LTIRRLSLRTHRLDETFLAEHLKDARIYRRIAGYFTRPLFEIAHGWLETVEEVRDYSLNHDDYSRQSARIGRLHP
jgi:hypothetical protein